jgi:arginase
MGPEALRVAGLLAALRARDLEVEDFGNLSGPGNPWQPPHNGYRHLPEVVRWNQLVHETVLRELREDRLPILLGGDHCLGIGSISAVARHCREQGRKLRVLWLDAHADFNTSELSPSGNVHGMPLAALLGEEPSELSHLGGWSPKVLPAHTVLVGIRDLDEHERAAVRSSGARVFTMKEVDRLGIVSVMEQAIDLAGTGTAGLHVSFDMDACDPTDAPGVGTPVRGGLSYREAHMAMEILAESGRLTSLDVVEVNPALDVRNTTAELGTELILSALGLNIL